MRDIVKEVWYDEDTGVWLWRVTETIQGRDFVVGGKADSESEAFLMADVAEVAAKHPPAMAEPPKAKPKKARKRRK